MNFAFLTACLYPNTSYIRLLVESADYFNIDLKPYGVGMQCGDWVQAKYTELMKAAAVLPNYYTHIVYTDGRDAMFCGTERQIVNSYLMYDAPPLLLSAETNCYPFPELGQYFTNPSPWRYPNAGQFIVERDYLLEHWPAMEKRYNNGGPESGNDQGWILQSYVKGHLPQARIDVDCGVFQSWGDTRVGVGPDGWVYNDRTGSYPSLVHFNGGYTDPVKGKEDRMQPVWECIREQRKEL